MLNNIDTNREYIKTAEASKRSNLSMVYLTHYQGTHARGISVRARLVRIRRLFREVPCNASKIRTKRTT